jgi:hypothetical protein
MPARAWRTLSVVAVLSSPLTACGGGDHPKSALSATLRAKAVAYARLKLELPGVHAVREIHDTTGCAMVEVATPAGTRRVVFEAQGPPDDPWEALIVSRSFAWSDFVYGGEDALCGIFASGLFSKADLPRTGHATS